MNMVEQIKERRAKITKGKWASNDDGEVHYEHPSKIWKRIVKCEFIDDANFIANAPTDIDSLIRVCECAEEYLQAEEEWEKKPRPRLTKDYRNVCKTREALQQVLKET